MGSSEDDSFNAHLMTIFRKGNCPNIELMKDLDPKRLTGEWFWQRSIDPAMLA